MARRCPLRLHFRWRDTGNWRTLRGVLSCGLQTRRARLPMRGTSGSVQRGPANPARPGREQRYRVSQVCRGDPEVPRFEKQISVISDQISATRDVERLFATWSLISGRWSLTPNKLLHSKRFDFFGADAENEPTLCKSA